MEAKRMVARAENIYTVDSVVGNWRTDMGNNGGHTERTRLLPTTPVQLTPSRRRSRCYVAMPTPFIDVSNLVSTVEPAYMVHGYKVFWHIVSNQ